MSDRPRPFTTRRLLVVAILSLVVIQGAVSFTAVPELSICGIYDPAWYYTAARAIARGDAGSPPLIWHYLGPVDAAPRWPGEFWPPGWPWLLGGLMRLAGDSMTSANAIVACLSLLLPVLVFRLVHLISGRIGLAWGAGIIAVLQPSLQSTNVRPDVSLPYQLAVLSGLVLVVSGVSRRETGRWRWLAAGALLALPLWLRGEGFVAWIASAVALLAGRDAERSARLSRAGWLTAGAAAGALPYLLYNLAVFGALTPAPRAMLPFLVSYGDIYSYLGDPTPGAWWAQGLSVIAGAILAKAGGVLSALLTVIPVMMAPLALAGLLRGGSGGIADPRTLAIALTAILGWGAQVALVPVVVLPDRLVEMCLPLLCILAALGIGAIFPPRSGESPPSREGSRPVRRRRAAAGAAVLGGAALIAGCTAWYWPVQLRNPLDRAWATPLREFPAHLKPEATGFLGKSDLVLAQEPWLVAAALDVPVMRLPADGTDAAREAIRKLHPRYVLILAGYPHLERAMVERLGIGLRLISRHPTGSWYRIEP